MKNLKKVLALVLAFACAFTMFAGAVVYPDVPAGSEYSEAITMLSDLGIIQGKDDGKYHSEDTITRAEACALIARMLTGDPQVSQYAGASNFTDVVKGSWKESVVGYCVVNGITVGVGNNKFEPDRAITDAEFVTMVVRAMGYETTGTSYPYGHISAAQANGLLDDVTVVPSSAALRGEDAQIIYNALFADYARGAKQVNTTHGTTVEEYPTIAEDVFGLERAAVGTFDKDGNLKNCKAHTWVITGEEVVVGSENMIVALPITDDKVELYDANKYKYVFEYEGDIDALKGYQVELWGEGQHGEPEMVKTEDEQKVYSFEWEIKAVKTVKGQTGYAYTPADEELPDVDNDEVRGFVGGTELKADDNIVWGNKKLAEKDVEDALQTKNSASYTLIDWDSDGSTDFIVGDIYKYFKVESVSKKAVKLVDMAGNKATLDTDGETDVTINGQKYTIKAEFPTDLEEDDILEVSTSEVAGKKKIVSTWTVEVVEPETKELTKVNTKKGAYFDDELIHDAEAYNGVKYFFEDTDDKYEKLNEDSEDNWDLWLDANGFIIKMKVSDESWKGFLFVTGAANGTTDTGSKRKYAEISGVTDENEVLKDVELVKDADVTMAVWDADAINATTGAFVKVDAFDGYEFKKKNGNAINPKGHVFKYQMNDDGRITKMVEVAIETGIDGDYQYVDKTDSLQAAGEKNWMDKADVIFVVKRTATEYLSLYRESDGYSIVNLQSDYALTTSNHDIKKDLDTDNVMAVKYDEIPDIDHNVSATTESEGVRFDRNTDKDEIKAAVLGVDSFRYFGNVSVKAGLLTKLTSNNKADTYTAEAYIPGMDGIEFDTIKAGDVDVKATARTGATNLDELHKLLEVGAAAKNGIYCEFEFDKDNKLTAITLMDEDVQYVHDSTDGVLANQTDKDQTYKVIRAGLNSIRNEKTMTIHGVVSAGVDSNKVYTYANGEYEESVDLTSDTKYYKVGKKKVALGENGSKLNAWVDGFIDDFKVEDGSLDGLESYVRSEHPDDEYTIVDVIVDDDEAVAVFYYDKEVKEQLGAYNGYITATMENAAVAGKNGQKLTVKTDVLANTRNITIKKGSVNGTDVHKQNTMFAWSRGVPSSNGVWVGEYTTNGNVEAGTYYVVHKGLDGTTTISDSFTIGKADLTGFVSAAYDINGVDITIDKTEVFNDVKVADIKVIATYNNGDKAEIAGQPQKQSDRKTIKSTFNNPIDAQNIAKIEVTVPETANYKAITVEAANKGDAPVVVPVPAITSVESALGASTITVTLAGGNAADYTDKNMWTAKFNGNNGTIVRVVPDGANKVVLQMDNWTTVPGKIDVTLTVAGQTVSGSKTIA